VVELLAQEEGGNVAGGNLGFLHEHCGDPVFDAGLVGLHECVQVALGLSLELHVVQNLVVLVVESAFDHS